MTSSTGAAAPAAELLLETGKLQVTTPTTVATELDRVVTVDEAIQQVGIGPVQYSLLFITGLTFMSDVAEVTFLSYLTEVLRCQWSLTAAEESSLASMVYVGMIVGAPGWGYLADTYGRRPAFLLSSLTVCVFGLCSALSNSFTQLMVLRGIVGCAIAGIPVAFDMLAEALPKEKRGTWLLNIWAFWTIGGFYVNACAWLTLGSGLWRVFTALVVVPTLLASIVGYFVVPESPRWLVEERREQEALEVLNSWARQNGREVQFTALDLPEHKHHERAGSHVLDVFQKPQLRRNFFLMTVAWFGFGVAYYGVVMLLPRIFENHRKHSGHAAHTNSSGCGHVTFNFGDLTITALAELGGLLFGIALIERPGRTYTQGISYTIGACAAVVLAFPSLGTHAIFAAACAGRMAEMAGSCATWLQTTELFPTKVLAEVHTMLNSVSKIGAAFAPFLISDMFSQRQAGLIIALVSFIAGVAAMLLPETSGRNLAAIHGEEE
eukprot:TRINITY_DN5679_c1_g4_i1.p1 TRINITY_DN5679_c1_g4~~TRINITY_DN5679_c1_g4_i1.p1  ORF type:complete len:502 (+),score=100.27 TRINITY_DN5679_c1_g4_i1:29-1507(+)